MKTIKLAMLFALTIFLFSCSEQESAWFPVEGMGNMRTENRFPEPFSKVKSLINCNLTIRQNDRQELTLTAQENLLEILETEVVNGTLFISFGSHVVETDSTMTVLISVPEIKELTFSGSGNVNSNLGIASINLTGTGNVKCLGETDQLSVKLLGSGNVDLEAMKVKNADIRISGNGNVSLHVTDKLNVTIPGVGVVYYSGMPNIQQNVTGIGQVIVRK
ncbi:MAG TPA: hypothetical protein DHV48_09915 [Prolixibacteraceae bacterium]|nr:hypothetical protein [Prolixibacteraceae bacterium]